MLLYYSWKRRALKSSSSALSEPTVATAASQKAAYDPRHFQWNIDVEKKYSFEGDLGLPEPDMDPELEAFELNLGSLSWVSAYNQWACFCPAFNR